MSTENISPVFSVWEGVHESFAAAGPPEDIFAGDKWTSRAVERLETDLRALHADHSIASLAIIREHPLPLLAAVLRATKPSVRVLDFGGGLAVAYLRLLAHLSEASTIEYHIVEGPVIAAAGRERLRAFPNLHFHSNIPAGIQPVDIIYAASSLHYVENWRECLRTLAGQGAPWMLLSDVPAGDIPTFVTHQIYYGSRMPVWFWNLPQFIEMVESTGYRLVYKAGYRATILGREGPLPMDGLPSTHRLDHCCDLLFRAET